MNGCLLAGSVVLPPPLYRLCTFSVVSAFRRFGIGKRGDGSIDVDMALPIPISPWFEVVPELNMVMRRVSGEACIAVVEGRGFLGSVMQVSANEF